MASRLRKVIKTFHGFVYDVFGRRNGKLFLRLLTESLTIIAIVLLAVGVALSVTAIAEAATPGGQNWLYIVAHISHEAVACGAMAVVSIRGTWTLWRWFRNGE